MKIALTTLWILALVTVGPLASAQDEPGAAQEHLARTFREQGVEAARGGDWAAARVSFARSYELDPRILTLYNLAAAELNSGALVEADEHFRRFLRATEDGTHPQFHAEALRYRGELATQIGKLIIEISNLESDDHVELDGDLLAHAALGAELPANPGRHTITVTRRGQAVGEDSVVLADGAVERVSITLSAASVPTPRETAGASQQPLVDPFGGEVEAERSHRGRNIAIGILVGAAVVAGLVVGGVFLFGDSGPEPYQGDFNVSLK